MLTRDLILAADDLRREPVEVPEWGDTVYVREMTGLERDTFEQHAAMRRVAADKGSIKDIAIVNAMIVATCVCDEHGTALFAETDAEALGKKNWKALLRLAAAAMRINQIGPDALRSAEKNLGAGQDAGSPID